MSQMHSQNIVAVKVQKCDKTACMICVIHFTATNDELLCECKMFMALLIGQLWTITQYIEDCVQIAYNNRQIPVKLCNAEGA